MKIRQLEAFRAVVLCQTVTRAAEMLYISQPAATRLISDLEEDVGFSLFERRRGRLIPTAEGLALYDEVERSLIGVERIARAAQEIKASRIGLLQIAAPPAISLSLLPRAIATFLENHPDVKISFEHVSSRAVIDMLNEQRCNLGFMMLPLNSPSTYGEKLISTNMVCILPLGHHLANKDVIEPKDLDGEPMILHTRDAYQRLRIDALFTSFGVSVIPKIESQTNAGISKFVAAGLGAAIIDPFTAIDFQPLGLVVKRFLPLMHDDFQVIVPTQRTPSLLARTFIEHVRQCATDFLPPEYIAVAD